MFISFATVVFCLIIAGLYWRRKPSCFPLPPGPKGYPIIGNLFDAPTQHHWVKYLEWSKRYNSDVIHFRVFGTSVIVLNSLKAAQDLVFARSSLYSDRPTSTMLNDLLGWGSLFSFMSYGDAWRIRRRAFWQEFNAYRTLNHRPKQLDTSRDLLRRLLKEPEEFLHHIKYTLAAGVISVVYGFDVKPENDPNITRAEKALEQLNESAISGNFLVDILPVLRYVPSWMPGAGFKSYAKKARPETLDMFNAPYDEACSRIQTGDIDPSVISRILESGNYTSDRCADRDVVRDVASAAYAGGAETSHAVLSTFIAAMLLYPDVQAKGQREIDSYIGARLPNFDDLPHMPYVHAIMLEVLRWQAVLPLSVAHRLTMDDEYNGYYLPKHSTIFVNTWAILRDEEYYPDPDSFKPGRFLKDGKVDPKHKDLIVNFGYGRRYDSFSLL
ncbi:hypothetical protein PTI98_005489 [Pleurotus ostreatus]|nr:hypothetical protein PTI98_005489 [Pleurotus ostreatus]